ncbi:MAG: M23 family metallopeptidase, partial [Actinobacteria bacterium]|nr:M23 family metallopeptidase [Actinomycetota bacterium]
MECCGLAIRHDSGWESWYLHLNNDTPGTDDGAGWGIMPGLERGSRVRAGQVIGWMGDSTNAESTAPHLHLELHDPAGNPVDPYPHLRSSLAASPSCPSS